MKLLELTDSTSNKKVVIVAQNVFAVQDGTNEFNHEPETRVYSAGSDYFGVKEPKEEIIKELASL